MQTQFAHDRPAEVVGVVSHAPHSLVSQVGEVAPHLGSVDADRRCDLLRGNGRPSELVEALEVASEAPHGGTWNFAHCPILIHDRAVGEASPGPGTIGRR